MKLKNPFPNNKFKIMWATICFWPLAFGIVLVDKYYYGYLNDTVAFGICLAIPVLVLIMFTLYETFRKQ
jgi:hypothetical protein